MNLNQRQGAAVGGLLGLLVVAILIAVIGASPISFLPMAVAAVLLLSLLLRRD